MIFLIVCNTFLQLSRGRISFSILLLSQIIYFSKNRSRELWHERVLLVNLIFDLKLKLTSGDFSVSSEISELESELMALTLKELDGSKVPFRVNWLKEGVRPTHYFFEIERERFERNILLSIQILTMSRFLLILYPDLPRSYGREIW